MTARRNPLAERREQLRHPRRQHGPLPFGNSRDNRRLCPLRRLHGQARLAGRHQRTDLVPRERPPQIRQRPPRLEQRRRVIMDVVHQEDAFPQPRDRRLHLRAVKRFPRRGRCSFQSIQHTEFVALGLQPADEPRSTVRQPLVVEVDGVLRRQHHTQSERPRLFEQREHRQLRGRIGRRREVAKHLIHVEHGPQARRAGLRPHPRNHLVQQDRHEEHPLGVRQMRQRQNRQPGFALFRMQQPANIERLALHPGRKARRGEQVVEAHRQREPLLRREEAFEVHHADFLERRGLNLANQPPHIEVAPLPPGPVKQVRDQNMLAAPQRIGIDTQQRQQPRGRRRDPLAHRLRILQHRLGRHIERFHHRQRQSRRTPRRVDRDIHAVLKPRNPLAIFIPLGEAILPLVGRLLRKLVHRQSPADRFGRIDPRFKIFLPQLGERQ